MFGRIPKAGEEVRYNYHIFKVEKVIGRRISKIIITKKTKDETPSSDDSAGNNGQQNDNREAG
ncbi:MAG: hypothetical protein HY779_01535 [Rubrobacteridae bacterium]|nr:hypothetical protein [Rubrobacteridae bacterium]